MEDRFLAILAEQRKLLPVLCGMVETDNDPVEVRRRFATLMLDLNAIASEEGYGTGQYMEYWQELAR